MSIASHSGDTAQDKRSDNIDDRGGDWNLSCPGALLQSLSNRIPDIASDGPAHSNQEDGVAEKAGDPIHLILTLTQEVVAALCPVY